jgi:2-iminobutanoate/2-iminopropanoate deaminase
LISEAIHTQSAPTPRGHYSQAVRAGDFLFISGQLPLDREGRMLSGTIVDETKQALANVRAILEAAGGSMASLVQCTIYISDISHWTEADEAYGAFFSGVPVLPARAIVPVKEMHFGAHIEIQAVAIVN